MAIEFSKPKPATKVKLIPWDPTSPDHVQRLFLQRKACGWNFLEVTELWIKQQQEGHKSIQWIVLDSTDKSADGKLLAKHTSLFPDESASLLDSATSLGGKPFIPSGEQFVPIGHISLDSDGADLPGRLSYDLKDVYRITTFYVSDALQGTGVGRLAMDILEATAVSEPLCAKTLVLSTAADEYESKEEVFKTLGREMPGFLVAQWYQRRGYILYKEVEAAWTVTEVREKTGKLLPVNAVYLKKDIQ